jgi:hypothetical protein
VLDIPPATGVVLDGYRILRQSISVSPPRFQDPAENRVRNPELPGSAPIDGNKLSEDAFAQSEREQRAQRSGQEP